MTPSSQKSSCRSHSSAKPKDSSSGSHEGESSGCSPSGSTVSKRPDFGDVEGRDKPFDPSNTRCNAPCPPGAFCNTRACDQGTEYYVQRWTCLWKRTHLDCSHEGERGCGYTKAWRCRFQRIQRCEVLKAFSGRPPPQCPEPNGDSECFVPKDAYFARVYEIEYVPCSILKDELGDDKSDDKSDDDCGCCGLQQVLKWRFVKIDSKEDIPPARPLEPPKPWARAKDGPRDERAYRSSAAPRCAGALCTVGPAKSPDYWLAPVFPYA